MRGQDAPSDQETYNGLRQHGRLDQEMYNRLLLIYQFRPLIQLSVTVVLLCASLFVILSKRYTTTDRHWAYATVGTLIGFWLKG
jgi:hypothetical protein